MAKSTRAPRRTQASKYKWRPKLLLRQVRMRRQLTQTALARLIGVTPSRISEYESGARTPSNGMLDDLGLALGCQTFGELVDPASRFGQDNPPG